MPTRGRPHNLARLTDAYAATIRADTHIIAALDTDDPMLTASRTQIEGRDRWVTVTGARRTLSGWTNHLAGLFMDDYRALASFGDDHFPETVGWDQMLLASLAQMGGTGLAYPNDLRRVDIPEAVVISSDIPRALGWMCEPHLHHYNVDSVWRDLGKGAHCLAYRPDVIVRHEHPNVTASVAIDRTYAEASKYERDDYRAYVQWRIRRMPVDVATVRRLSETARQTSGRDEHPRSFA